MKGAATELIHAGEVDRGDAVPLTTPIYETTTFVFDNAQEVVAYNEGRSTKYPLLALHQPDGRQRRAKLAVLDRTEAALCSRPGMGATTTILMAHLKAGDEVRLQRGDLRRHAAPAAGPARALRRSRRGSSRSTSSRNLERVFSDRTRLVWFESPINPTLRCVDIRRDRRRLPRARRARRSSTTRSPARSTSSRSRSASTWRCRARRNTSTATATSPAASSPARRRWSRRSRRRGGWSAR